MHSFGKTVDLVWKDEEQFIAFNIELLQVHAMMGIAFNHKEQEVMLFAMGERVGINYFSWKAAECWGDKANAKFVVLFMDIEK